jgi:glucose-1-phosphate cytidylyltransferase
MKCVIFCGGKGTRLREETEYKPKPLVEIGGRPILWHIMKIYSSFGVKDFVLALGYKGDMIKRYFMEQRWRDNNFTINMKTNQIEFEKGADIYEDWNVSCVDTGLESGTGLRLYKLKKILEKDENFCITYGDGVANVNITELIDYHYSHKKYATMTGLHPVSKYGQIITDTENNIIEFKEKPILNDNINGGFMVFNKKIFDFMTDENVMMETTLLPKLAEMKQLKIYLFSGFWHSMDTYKDYEDLNHYWEHNPKWKVWK